MIVFYDPDNGAVTWTMTGDRLIAGATEPWIIVPDQIFPTLAGLQVENGALAYVDLTGLRRTAIAEVNAVAGAKRLEFITDIPGQQMLYQAKEQEAHGYIADASPDLANYPLIAAEIGITAPTAGDLANLWLAMGAQWRAAAAQIESARLGTVAAIETAADRGAIDAAMTAYRAVMGVGGAS